MSRLRGPMKVRLFQDSEAKAAIGRAAAELVADGDSLIIDSGTTALNLAQSTSLRTRPLISLRDMESRSQEPEARIASA
jgi:DeoR/GlpR family transcriptional regulator of sugar metabolism